MGSKLVVFLVILLVWSGGNMVYGETVTFREGLDGYAATQDTWFSDRSFEAGGFPEGIYIRTGLWSTNQQALLRFDHIFDNEGGLVPSGSDISNATLTIHNPADIQYSDGEVNAVHKMLVDWVETDAYGAAQWAGGATLYIDRDDAEAASVAVDDCTEYAINNKIPQGTTITFDVTAIVQDWSDGDDNYGFLLQSLGLNGGDGFFIASSEYSGSAGPISRPTLEVTFGAGVSVTQTQGTTVVEEGGQTDSYSVILHSEPNAEVDVIATPVDAQIDLGSGPGNAITLTFTTGNWNTAQTVTVTAVDDAFKENLEHTADVTFSVSSADIKYNGIEVGPLTVTIMDNECGHWGFLSGDLTGPKGCRIVM